MTGIKAGDEAMYSFLDDALMNPAKADMIVQAYKGSALAKRQLAAAVETESQTWNRRHREYQDKMRTGSIFQAAEVYRDLSLLKENKDLSHGERRLFDQAYNLLIKELSIAKKTDETEIERTLNNIFEKSSHFTAEEKNNF